MLFRITEDCRIAAECLYRTVPAMITAAFQLIGAFIFLWYFSTESHKPEQVENTEPAGIIFHNVTFTYQEKEQPVFRRFNHNFAPGS